MGENQYSKTVMRQNRIFHRYPTTTVIITIICTLLVLDILLSYIIKLPQNWNQISLKSISMKHPVYHHGFKKLAKAKHFLSMIHTNSLGFKDKLIRTVDLESANYRILFMGDSFTEGIYLNYPDTFVGIIDSVLSIDNIEVLNAGRSGYSPIIYWRKIKYLMEDVGLKFDEVVVYIDISDPSNELNHFQLTDDLLVIPRVPISTKKSDNNLLTIQDSKRWGIKNIKSLIYNNTTVIYFVFNKIYDFLNFNIEERKQLINHLPKPPDWEKTVSYHALVDPMWTMSPNSNISKEGNRLMIRYMDRLANLLKEKNIPLTIAIYPWPTQIWYEDINSIHVKIWEQWANKNKIKLINYFPDFITLNQNESQKLSTLNKYYIPSDIHFNKEGNKVLANKFLKLYNKRY